MIWHTGRFLTWPGHKNPLSLPRLHLHRKDELHGFLQSFHLKRTVTWWGEQSTSRRSVNEAYLHRNIWNRSMYTHTHTHKWVCTFVRHKQLLVAWQSRPSCSNMMIIQTCLNTVNTSGQQSLRFNGLLGGFIALMKDSEEWRFIIRSFPNLSHIIGVV